MNSSKGEEESKGEVGVTKKGVRMLRSHSGC